MNRVITVAIALLFALQLSAQVLVIPDIHGRTYWKEATAKYPNLPVIFLGDYLDPYSYEGITSGTEFPIEWFWCRKNGGV